MRAIELFLCQLGEESNTLLTYSSITAAEYTVWVEENTSVKELPLKVFTILCTLSHLSYDEVLKQLVKYELLAE
ncbi:MULTISPECIES: hypothetical protein [Enterococcus]|uniref:Uncharacterized protein n=1 Tax=Candidatus Enterococcus ferrettii TaxID=2815324 RepID=A0ABV0ET01_9ENTE|nr:hypothetical protein [Enterococcus sp. 665A]MBO1341327.1 hypothetical protein [Enterococcus sp. 665A]